MTREAGKGSKRRPGNGYADGWERIWGKRQARRLDARPKVDKTVQPVTAGETAQNIKPESK